MTPFRVFPIAILFSLYFLPVRGETTFFSSETSIPAKKPVGIFTTYATDREESNYFGTKVEIYDEINREKICRQLDLKKMFSTIYRQCSAGCDTNRAPEVEKKETDKAPLLVVNIKSALLLLISFFLISAISSVLLSFFLGVLIRAFSSKPPALHTFCSLDLIAKRCSSK